MRNILRNILIGGLLLLSMQSVLATSMAHLTERDWTTVDDGFLTYDSTSGLEWLDLSLTTGNSILATEADSSIFGPFRWATGLEIQHLLSHIGQTLNTNETDVSLFGAATAFIDLLSPTGSFGEMLWSMGVSRGSVDASSPGNFGLGYAGLNFGAPGQSDVFDPFSNCCWLSHYSSDSVGSWLVREADVDGDVPEPSIALLLASGLLGIGFVRRRRVY